MTTCIARAGDGTYLVAAARDGALRLSLGKPVPDCLDVSLGGPSRLVGAGGGIVRSGTAAPALAMVVTPGDVLFLAWAQDGDAFLTSCSLAGKGGAERATKSECYAGRRRVGPGLPSDAAFNPATGWPVFAGWSPEGGGTVWVSRAAKSTWTYETVASGQGQTVPRLAVSARGVAHLVWRTSDGAVLHVESGPGGRWLRSGRTTHVPEPIGTAAHTPAAVCARHQTLVVLPTAASALEYSLDTGQGWDQQLPLSAPDPRWRSDTLAQPRLVVDGRGVPWLFFISTARKYVYYTRWLGFAWDTIREARGFFHVTDDFGDNLAAVDDLGVPAFVRPGADEVGIAAASWRVDRPLRACRLVTPQPVAEPGADILFLDMLDVGRSLWVGQIMHTAEKHPENPLLEPSDAPDSIDSHRVFNGGVVLRDGDTYKAWYVAGNPVGDWSKWWELLRLALATSEDGIVWAKPNLGLVELKGSNANNAIPGFNIFAPVMLNPEQGAPGRRFLALNPNRRKRHVSADGVHWTDEPVQWVLQGPQPKWFVYQCCLYDPDAGPSRRWRAYGCIAPKEPRRACGYAYSSDGRTFLGHPENPILQPETGVHPMCHDIAVTKYKGHYLALYQTGDGYSQHLELAVSRDGEHFTRIHGGQPLIAQGGGDSWDRGMHMPSPPLVVGDTIRLYYGGANYQAPTDKPLDYERWKMCRMAMGLATLRLDGWTCLRNTGGHHIGYVTTVPIAVGDLQGCVLTLNAAADQKNYLLTELLETDTDDRIPGYEHEHCDEVKGSGVEQVVTWRGKAGLAAVPGKSFRVRVIFRGRGDAVRLYSIGFRRRPELAANPPRPDTTPGLVERSLVYSSSLSGLRPLKAWVAYRPDGKPKPVLVAMHGYGEPVLRHGGRRMTGAVRHYARQGLVAVAPDLRGREESAGQRDDGGAEVVDIYDAVQAVLQTLEGEVDAQSINIIGWSGGGGNVFSAVTRMPDLFSHAAAFYGVTDYGHWARTTFNGVVQPNVGGRPEEVPDRYMARNSLLGVRNNAYTRFQFFWDEGETICPAWMDLEYRRLAQELGYDNITAHESKVTGPFRWLHEGMDRPSSQEAERLTLPLFRGKANPSPQIRAQGTFVVLGYLFTRRFRVVFGHGNDAVARLEYELEDGRYRFRFARQSRDQGVRGWLRVMDRKAHAVASVTQDGTEHPWTEDADGRPLVRDVRPDAELVVRFD